MCRLQWSRYFFNSKVLNNFRHKHKIFFLWEAWFLRKFSKFLSEIEIYSNKKISKTNQFFLNNYAPFLCELHSDTISKSNRKWTHSGIGLKSTIFIQKSFGIEFFRICKIFRIMHNCSKWPKNDAIFRNCYVSDTSF